MEFSPATAETNNHGKVVQVLGPVVDVEFKDADLPPIYTALKVTNSTLGEDEWNLVLEVSQQIGGNRVRCVAMDSTEGLQRGQAALNTGEGITIPVGKESLGRMINVVSRSTRAGLSRLKKGGQFTGKHLNL